MPMASRCQVSTNLEKKFVVVWPWSAKKGHAVALPPLPPLGQGGEEKQKGKKMVGRDKGSLTEQQMK